MTSAPHSVEQLAAARQQARTERDFARADELRAEISAAGWRVVDAPDGFILEPLPPYPVHDTLAALLAAQPRIAQVGTPACGIGLIIDGWPEDLQTCATALLAHAPRNSLVLLLDLGNVDGSGDVAHALAVEHPDRVIDLHVAQRLEQAGWADAVRALITLDPAPVHVVMDLSSVLTGDGLGPLIAALDEPGVVAAGWRGVDVDLADEWRSFVPAGPGEVDALLGYCLAVRTDVAREIGPNPKARFYRNADMEWSLTLRAAGGRLVVPAADLPIRQDRHRGYHDSDPAYRDRESKKTYERLLREFRGRPDILRPRS